MERLWSGWCWCIKVKFPTHGVNLNMLKYPGMTWQSYKWLELGWRATVQGKDKKRGRGGYHYLNPFLCFTNLFVLLQWGINRPCPQWQWGIRPLWWVQKEKGIFILQTRKTARTIYLQHTVHHLPVFTIPDISIKINMCHFQFYITVQKCMSYMYFVNVLL